MSNPNDVTATAIPAENAGLLEQAFLALIRVCDGAQSKDDSGFSGADTGYMHRLLPLVGRWSDGQSYAVYIALRKYRKQLLDYNIDYNAIPAPTKPDNYNDNAYRVVRYRDDDSLFIISFSFNRKLVAVVKDSFYGRFWNGATKSWLAKATKHNAEAIVNLEREFGFDIDGITQAKIDELLAMEDEPAGSIDYSDEFKAFLFRFQYDAELVNAIRQFPKRTWDKEIKAWIVPALVEQLDDIKEFSEKYKLPLTERASEILTNVKQKTDAAIEASQSLDAEVEVSGLGGELLPFQKACVKYISDKGSALICDEMGLGKTVEALASIQSLDAFPALIIVPATLRTNWLRESTKWLPERSVEILNGKSKKRQPTYETDIEIVSYAMVKKHAERLKKIPFKSIVVDECHYIKNYKAQRTIIIKEIAENIEHKMLLTGTPVLNRPEELLTQLDVLKVLDELGGFWHVKRYAWADTEKLNELNIKLRAACMIRRRKEDVLKELPDKRYSVQVLELSNRAEYTKEEIGFNGWLKAVLQEKADGESHKGDGQLIIVEIEKLKQLAARGKLEAAKDWIQNFIESGEKLVFFAWHRDIVDELAEYFNAPKIQGGMSDKKKQQNIDRFQTDDSCRLIVANIQAGGVGITLTAASNVAFLELGWNPSVHRQAEDRCHRIGQKKSVTAWYLLAEDSIDEDIYSVIEKKRKVVDRITDGENFEADEEMLDQLIGTFMNRTRKVKELERGQDD